MGIDLEKLPGWSDLQESAGQHPHGSTIILSAKLLALQAYATAQDQALARIADVLAMVAGRLPAPPSPLDEL